MLTEPPDFDVVEVSILGRVKVNPLWFTLETATGLSLIRALISATIGTGVDLSRPHRSGRFARCSFGCSDTCSR